MCDHPKPSDTVLQEPQPESTMALSIVNEQERTAGGGGMGGSKMVQRRLSPPLPAGQAEVQIELASGAVGAQEENETDFKKLKQIRNRMRRSDWLFLNACAGETKSDSFEMLIDLETLFLNVVCHLTS